ncbi:conserved Plasmodium protein, unknown function [Plasmodium reichenowi]|uniref:Uncharacterized protein n=1 Tax=Plasmodium reichenowi TaxID=5854 RepID=A0A060RVD5_PLARE|nr:hypothetical protein PRSY57_0625000 [Plasmodium reichenowi]KYO01146.1 hypothetical protein PRSY57_0625000 [Plasmodium reichenowi]CDO63450.1 conserved Plasmodium protein, unknown function [Plasmodium reichenowi]SOV77605.1 conserved Plasmodium protein, unknown function [Plasmodium reichenowi]
MLKYIFLGIGGSVSGWMFRDVIVQLAKNINSENALLINKFVCSKDDFYTSIFSDLKYCFDSLELKPGFNNYNIYLKEDDYFLETLYMEKWTSVHNMNEYINSDENKKKLYDLKNKNIFFSPTLFVLLKKYSGSSTPEYLKVFQDG